MDALLSMTGVPVRFGALAGAARGDLALVDTCLGLAG